MQLHGVDIPQPQIAAFCRRRRIRRLALFGSILRDDFTPESDIDVLVEFEPEASPGLAFFGLQRELSDILGRNVDLNTPAELSRFFRDDVLGEARVLYVAAPPPGVVSCAPRERPHATTHATTHAHRLRHRLTQ